MLGMERFEGPVEASLHRIVELRQMYKAESIYASTRPKFLLAMAGPGSPAGDPGRTESGRPRVDREFLLAAVCLGLRPWRSWSLRETRGDG